MTIEQSPVISSRVEVTEQIPAQMPTDHPYGIFYGETYIGCTREQLIQHCFRNVKPARRMDTLKLSI